MDTFPSLAKKLPVGLNVQVYAKFCSYDSHSVTIEDLHNGKQYTWNTITDVNVYEKGDFVQVFAQNTQNGVVVHKLDHVLDNDSLAILTSKNKIDYLYNLSKYSTKITHEARAAAQSYAY